MKNFEWSREKTVIFAKLLEGASFNVEESALSNCLFSVLEVHGDEKSFVVEIGVGPDLKDRFVFTVIETLDKVSLLFKPSHTLNLRHRRQGRSSGCQG